MRYLTLMLLISTMAFTQSTKAQKEAKRKELEQKMRGIYKSSMDVYRDSLAKQIGKYDFSKFPQEYQDIANRIKKKESISRQDYHKMQLKLETYKKKKLEELKKAKPNVFARKKLEKLKKDQERRNLAKKKSNEILKKNNVSGSGSGSSIGSVDSSKLNIGKKLSSGSSLYNSGKTSSSQSAVNGKSSTVAGKANSGAEAIAGSVNGKATDSSASNALLKSYANEITKFEASFKGQKAKEFSIFQKHSELYRTLIFKSIKRGAK